MKRLTLVSLLVGSLVALAFVFWPASKLPKAPIASGSTTGSVVSGTTNTAHSHAATMNSPAGANPTAIPFTTNDSSKALAAFSNWVERQRVGDASATLAQGVALAWKRREVMLELIENDPASAINMAAPFQWRTELPSDITRHLEQWVDGMGSLTVLVGTDFEQNKVTVKREVEVGGKTYQAFVFGRRTAQVSQTSIPLHGIALAGKLAVY